MSNDTKTDEVVERLYRNILEGVYETGQRLPSERDLAEEMNVSRPTIRSALLRLQSENVIDIVPKSGIYVRWPRTKITIGPLVPVHLKQKKTMEIFRNQRSQEKEIHMRFLEAPAIVPAQGKPGLQMNVEVGTSLLRRYRLCFMNQVPYRIVDSYYPTDLLPADMLKEASSKANTPLQWLQGHTKQFHPDAYERFICRMPDAKEAELLNISRNQPVVEIERWIFVAGERVFEYTNIIANAALHEFTYTYDTVNWDDLTDKMLVGS